MRFDRHFLDELRRRVSISDIVGGYVKLSSKGKGEFTGLCPFHNEKTPSFTVSDAKGFYHCFGCGAHGDAIRFYTEKRGLSYPEAIKELAASVSMPLPVQDKFEQAKQRKLNDSLEVMERAARWFEANLKSNIGGEARSYLKKRGLSDATIAKFRIGFVSDEWEGLKKHLKSLGAEDDLLLASGLVSKNGQGTKIYDRFRSRIIFPIFDSRNKVIAFGGRIINSDSNAPKYLNSPETDLFKKGYVLYGYNFARDEAYKKEQMIVAEGYMDIISLHQAGITNAVAPLGTSVTENHIKQLWKTCDEPVFCLDGDNAGLRAMMRLAENHIHMLEPGKTMRLALLPDKMDPDDVIKSYGVKGFYEIIENAKDLSDALWDINIRDEKLKTPEQKSAFAEKMLNIVKTINQKTVRDFYIRDYQNRIYMLGFNRSKKGKKNNKKGDEVQISISNIAKIDRIIEKMLILVAYNPATLEEAEIEEFIQNIETSNKNLEKLSFSLIDYISFVDCDGADYQGFRDHLKENGGNDQIEYLEKTPLKSEYGLKMEGKSKYVTAWQYLKSEYNVALAENEFKNLSSSDSSDISKIYLAKNEVVRLELKRDEQRQIFEDLINNELI